MELEPIFKIPYDEAVKRLGRKPKPFLAKLREEEEGTREKKFYPQRDEKGRF